MLSPFKLIKALPSSQSPIGRLKSISTSFQLDLDSSLVQSIASSIASNSSLRKDKISGKLIIYLQLGGIMGVELEQVETFKPSNDLK